MKFKFFLLSLLAFSSILSHSLLAEGKQSEIVFPLSDEGVFQGQYLYSFFTESEDHLLGFVFLKDEASFFSEFKCTYSKKKGFIICDFDLFLENSIQEADKGIVAAEGLFTILIKNNIEKNSVTIETNCIDIPDCQEIFLLLDGMDRRYMVSSTNTMKGFNITLDKEPEVMKIDLNELGVDLPSSWQGYILAYKKEAQ